MFWGKARPRDDTSARWHPVAYHLLDVAAIADALLDGRPIAQARAGRLLGLEPDDARRLLVALIALHDLGKFAPAFQAKAPDHWPSVLGPYDPGRATGTRHTDDGYVLWTSELAGRIGGQLWRDGAHALEMLAPAVFGHHGRPVRSGALRNRQAAWLFGSEALSAATACADALTALLLPEPIEAGPIALDRARVASWWVAGLITIADWIGSREEWFPYTAPMAAPDGGLAGYWNHARERARIAVRQEGLAAPAPASLRTFTGLTGIATPSPAQLWAQSVPLPAGPVLVFIEDVTGAGKTEAAQMLVHRLIATGRASGVYWAMPTQATANAMYGRQAKAIDKLFDLGACRPSLVLAHGQSRLHDGFRATICVPAAGEPSRYVIGEAGDEDLTSGAACAAFFADDRRAAFLADVSAGTVDQALLGVLASKFNAVRLFGLAEKVLVVDEAHAYDAYMGVEIRELLRFHAALGGCAVVLSATLSRKQREGLATAWREGLNGGQRRVAPLFGRGPAPVPTVSETAYPLATVVAGGAGGACETPLAAAPWSCRSVHVHFVHHVSAALEHVLAAARHGAAVVWVRNTVDDCLGAATALRARGVAPLVFHARFAQGDRQRREAEVLRLFGKDARDEERWGRVLVATQVVEQSLDLDFDVMVTDVAPVDLLIQRAGRLWRHPVRDAARRAAGFVREIVVLAPHPDPAAPRDWLTALLPGTARVYEDTGVLWRTVRALAEVGAIETPGGLRYLIEAVYASDDVPDALRRAADVADGKARTAASTANYAVLKVTDGYCGDAHGWVDDLVAMTRWSESPTTTVRLARAAADGQLVPWEQSGSPAWKAWALSEVRPRASRVPASAVVEPVHRAAVEAARADWGRFEQDLSVLPLVEAEPGVWRGILVDPERGRLVPMSYTVEQGLDFS